MLERIRRERGSGSRSRFQNRHGRNDRGRISGPGAANARRNLEPKLDGSARSNWRNTDLLARTKRAAKEQLRFPAPLRIGPAPLGKQERFDIAQRTNSSNTGSRAALGYKEFEAFAQSYRRSATQDSRHLRTAHRSLTTAEKSHAARAG